MFGSFRDSSGSFLPQSRSFRARPGSSRTSSGADFRPDPEGFVDWVEDETLWTLETQTPLFGLNVFFFQPS